jgi:hypothetical protein
LRAWHIYVNSCALHIHFHLPETDMQSTHILRK